MKLALIPPVSEIETVIRSKYHLILPQVCMAFPEYEEYYSNLTSAHFFILDNGAAEGEMVDADTLLHYALALRVNEIVAPDSMYSAEETAKMFHEFCDYADNWWYEEGEPGRPLPGVMLVAQGQTVDEVLQMVEEIMRSDNASYVTSIGLPRHLNDTLSGEVGDGARINIALRLFKLLSTSEFLPVAFHFLGATPTYHQELLDAGAIVPFVRGMDTSLPFNATFAKKDLVPGEYGTRSEHIGRPDNYFALEGLSEVRLNKNIDTMMGWAHGS